MNYADFLKTKRITAPGRGFEVSSVSTQLFDFQADIVKWALRKGRAAIFADCGMGKTPMQLEWANHIPGRTLILRSSKNPTIARRRPISGQLATEPCRCSRLDQITRCMQELENVRKLRPQYPNELRGLLIGELDWLEELHFLLHES